MLPSEEPKEAVNYTFVPNTVYFGDCMEVMKSMKDHEVDYTFTSPPYNIGGSYKKYGKGGKEHKDDMGQQAYFEWSVALIDELLRVTKQHVFYNIQEFADNRIALDTLIDHFKYKIKDKCIWAKDHGSMATNQQVMSCKWEYILIFSNQNPLQKNFEDAWFGGKFSNLIKDIKRGKNMDADINKATFPIDLPRKFIRQFGKPGDIWYDPFMGTGTSARACIMEGRKYVGSEMSKAMHTRCLSNIKKATNNPYFDFYEEIDTLPKKEEIKAVDMGGKHPQIEMELFKK